jgi:hypothetical protein
MNVFKENKIFIVILLVNLMFTFSIVAQSYLMIDFKLLPLTLIFSISVAAYFLFDFILNKTIQKIFFVLLIITFGLAYIFYFGLATALYAQISNDVVSINDAVKSVSVTYYQQYKLFFICFIPLLVFVFLMFANRGFTNLVLIYTMLVMVLFWYLGFPQIVKNNLTIFTFIGVISFGVNNCISGIRKLKNLNPMIKINSAKACLFFLIPAIIISTVTAKLPQSYKGNFIGISNGKFINTFSPAKNSLIKSTYGLESSGYSSNAKKLGGPVNINNDLILSIKADKSQYLRGSIKDNYNGFSWTRNKEDYSLKVKPGYSVLSSNDLLSKFLYNEKTLIVYPEESQNSSIFTPIYAYNVQLDKGNVYYDNIPTFIANLSKVKTYSINYYDFSEIQAFENCSSLDWMTRRASEGYLSFIKQKYENYLQVPSSVTQRTRDLLGSIVSSEESRYSNVSKIKEYLEKNYPYTTDVSTVPENQDFVDNFLFTEKKGYCVYFATAATILCRMQGIPARYVEGFKMPDSTDSDGLYKVTNKEAHAWCEILVDPYKDLWTTLEVTPSTVGTASTPIIPSIVVPENKAIIGSENKNENVQDVNTGAGNNINIGSYKVAKINIVICILISVLILIIGKILVATVQIKKVIKGKSTIPFYLFCLKRLKKIGMVRPDNLGDLEYIETIGDNALRTMLKETIIIAYDEFYGKKVTRNISKVNSYKELETYIKRNESKPLYFIRKYLLF